MKIQSVFSNALILYGYEHYRLRNENEFAREKSHVNGIESFWAFAKKRLVKLNDCNSEYFMIYLKGFGFWFNHRNENLYKIIGKTLKINQNEEKITMTRMPIIPFWGTILLSAFLSVESADTLVSSYPDPEALIREAFDNSDEPEKSKEELEEYLNVSIVEQFLKEEKIDEAMEYAKTKRIIEKYKKRFADSSVKLLIDKGRFEEATAVAQSIPADARGNGPSQLLQKISFRQSQTGRFEEAFKTASLLKDSWEYSARRAVEDEERRCTLLKNGKPLRNIDGTINDKTAAFSIFQFGRWSSSDQPEPLIADLLYKNDYTPDLVAAIERTKEKKDAEGKVLFDKVIGNNPTAGFSSGARTDWERLCGIAVIQFELGHPEWTRETLGKILQGIQTDNIRFFAEQDSVRVGHAIADVQVLLGELEAAQQTLEKYFPLDGKIDDIPSYRTIAWTELAKQWAAAGNQEKAIELLNRVLDHVKQLEHHFNLKHTVDALLLAAHDIADPEQKKAIFERTRRYVKIRNEREYRGTYVVMVKAFAREKMFEDALRFIGYEAWFEFNADARILLIDALFQAGEFNLLKDYRGRHNDLAPRVFCSRYLARLAFEKGDLDDAHRELDLAIALTRNVHFHDFFKRHTFKLDIAEDIKRYFHKH